MNTSRISQDLEIFLDTYFKVASYLNKDIKKDVAKNMRKFQFKWLKKQCYMISEHK